MTFFTFQSPPAQVGVLLLVLYLGPYVLPVLYGRADWLGRALLLQLAVLAGLGMLSQLFTERGLDMGGIILFSLLFLPFALVAAGLIALRNRLAQAFAKSSHKQD